MSEARKVALAFPELASSGVRFRMVSFLVKELFHFAALPVNIGSNTLTFGYTSLNDASHAGFQGLPDEGWGIEQVDVGVVGVVPEPSTWAMLVLGFAGIGFVAYRKRKSGYVLRIA